MRNFSALVGFALALTSCGPGGGPAASALSEADAASISADTKDRLQARAVRMSPLGNPTLCTNYFSIGDPKIVDATLGEQTGKVQVMVLIAVHTASGFDGHGALAPDQLCYGYSHPGWQLNQPYKVTFEFQIERWQSGWKVAQIQPNGF